MCGIEALTFKIFFLASSGTREINMTGGKSSKKNHNAMKRRGIDNRSIITQQNLGHIFRNCLYQYSQFWRERHGIEHHLFFRSLPYDVIEYVEDPKSKSKRKKRKVSIASEVEIAEYVNSYEFCLFGGLTRTKNLVIARNASLRFTDAISVTPFEYDVFFHTNGGVLSDYRRNNTQADKTFNSIYTTERHRAIYTFDACLDVRTLPQSERYNIVRLVLDMLANGASWYHSGILDQVVPLAFLAAATYKPEFVFHKETKVASPRNSVSVINISDNIMNYPGIMKDKDKIYGIAFDNYKLRISPNSIDKFMLVGKNKVAEFIKLIGKMLS